MKVSPQTGGGVIVGSDSTDFPPRDQVSAIALSGRWLRSALAVTIIGFIAVMAGHPGAAATVTLGLDHDFSSTDPGAAPPCSTCLPWIEVEITDLSPNLVSFAIKASHLTEPEHLKDLFLNLNPAYDSSHLSFASPTVGSGSFDIPTVSVGNNAYKADNDGNYDIHFSFTTGGGPIHQFEFGDILSYQVSLTSGGDLTANDFSFLSNPNPDSPNGPFVAAAHVLSTGPEGEQSSWVAAIPEPRAMALGAVALLLSLRRRR